MTTLSVSERIDAPAPAVFALATDLDGWAGYIKAIKKVERLTPGPVRVGTRFRETRVMFGREATEEMEFTSLEPDRGYALAAASCGCDYLSTFRFEPEGAGTRLTVTFEGRPRTIGAKLMAPLFWFMRGTMRKCLEQDLRDLKAAAERGVPAGRAR